MIAASPPELGSLAYHRGSRLLVRFILKEIFREHIYSRHGIAIGPGDTVVDVGANIGLFALYCDLTCGGDCTVFCFEPIPETAALLRTNVDRHATGSRVVVLERGLTCEGGPDELEFVYMTNNPGGSTYKGAEKWDRLSARADRWFRGRGAALRLLRSPWIRYWRRAFERYPRVRCKLTTLSRACEEHAIGRVNLLKVDVEDAELDVVNGIDDRTWPLIDQVVMEVHERERAAAIEATLRCHGFGRIHLDPVGWADDTYMLYAAR